MASRALSLRAVSSPTGLGEPVQEQPDTTLGKFLAGRPRRKLAVLTAG
jgi:hypothetical protein